MSLAGIFIYFARLLFFTLFIALCSHMYRKASGFEKASDIVTPEKDQLQKEIKYIKEQVGQLHAAKFKAGGVGDARVQFKNKKIVAWLLNRRRTHMREHREHFFKRVNEDKQVQFIEFEHVHELRPFLDSLFKLKPTLITSFSQDKFRIVIENFTGG